MLKTMLSFGITETLQVSGSFPITMAEGRLPPARMMSAMSSDREFEGLMAYRFQRRVVGIGGRQESTSYVGGTAPFEKQRNGLAVGPSIEGAVSSGYASRAHYVWVGGACSTSSSARAINSATLASSPLFTGIVPPLFEPKQGDRTSDSSWKPRPVGDEWRIVVRSLR